MQTLPSFHGRAAVVLLLATSLPGALLAGTGGAGSPAGEILVAQSTRKGSPMVRTTDPTKGTVGGFNLLESAVMDPATGEIELLGKTGGGASPIPYRQVLADALANPGPQFSLESDFSRFTREKLAGRSLQQILFTDEDRLTPFARETLEALGVPVPPGKAPRAGEFTIAILRQGGFSLAADLAASLTASGTVSAEALSEWILLLELSGEKATFDAAREGSGDAGPATDRFYRVLVQRLSESLFEEGRGVPAAYAKVRDGGGAPDEALRAGVGAFVDALEPLTIRAMEILLKRHNDSAIVLSSEDLTRAFGSTPVSRPRFINLDGTTQLARLLFEGDFALKSIPFKLALQAIEGYETFPEWARSFVAPEELGQARDNRYWVTVDTVELVQSSDGNIASFGEVRLAVESRTKESGEPWSAERIDPRTKQYADMLTAHYDAIAERVPELSRLREVAKVVALANWLREKNLTPRLDPAGEPWESPAEVSGFLAMMPYLAGRTVLWGIWPSGGVDFDFGSRIVVREDPSLTEESLRGDSGTRRLPTAEEAEQRRRDRLLQAPRPEDGDTPRAEIQRHRIEAAIGEIRRTETLGDSMLEAHDGVAVLNEYLLQSQRLQASTLRDAGAALGQAASSLASVDAAIAGAPEPDRSTLLEALDAAALEPPAGGTGALVELAREVQEEIRAFDPGSFRRFDAARESELRSLAGSEPFRRLASGVEAWDRKLATLERVAPTLHGVLAGHAPELDRFVRSAGLGRTALLLFESRASALTELLPNLGTAFTTEDSLRRILDRQLQALEAARQQLDALRG